MGNRKKNGIICEVWNDYGKKIRKSNQIPLFCWLSSMRGALYGEYNNTTVLNVKFTELNLISSMTYQINLDN